MKRHVTIAAFVLALAVYALGENNYRESQDQAQAGTTQPNQKLSKEDRKRQEKEEKKARKQQRKDEKHIDKQHAEEQRRQYKDEEKRAAKERRKEQKGDQKEVASNHKKEEKYERKEAQRAEKQEARDSKRNIERATRVERAAAVPPPRYGSVPRIPISTTATPGLLLAQREVSRAIYSQAPGSDVRILLNSGNQILLRGSAPTPSLRQRLLQAAIGAARGYSVVDQLAATLVSDAAGAATSAAFGGVSDLIHGRGSNTKDTGADGLPESGSSSTPQPSADSPQTLPNSDQEITASVLVPGSNACVNLADPNQAMLTGQATSQPSAELIRRFAHELASPSAVVVDQLAVRTNGSPNAGNAQQDVAGASGAATATNATSSVAAVSPGSTICVSEDHGEIFLTGTVGSTAELGVVENAAQPLVGSRRLLDQLTIGGMYSGNQIATASAPVNGAGATPPQQTEVEQALHSIPRLANVNVQVAVDGVHLSGSVDTSQDDQLAADLARQYAPGRPVLDKMTVANRTQPQQD